jgi:hypothetical protein
MAPEQVERPLQVDHRADIYSLGVVFYEMLTGQLPVGRFPMPSETAGTDPHLDGIVLHALEREPERRYQHASDVKTDVEGSARRPPFLMREPSVPDHDLALRLVRGPATALMTMAVVGPLAWLIPCLLLGVVALGLGPQRGGELAESAVAFGVLFVLNAVAAVFVFAGARRMKRLEAYEFCVITVAMALLQLATPTFLITLIVAAWAFWVLRKPDVKAAFIDNLKRSVQNRHAEHATSRPGEDVQDDIEPARARIQGASGWLLVTGIGYSVFTMVGGLIAIICFLYLHPPTVANADHWLTWLLVLLPLVAQGPIMILGALKMRHFESYGWAVAGSIVALVPVTPLAVFGLLVGIWALSVLTAPDVKAAFREKSDRTAPTD